MSSKGLPQRDLFIVYVGEGDFVLFHLKMAKKGTCSFCEEHVPKCVCPVPKWNRPVPDEGLLLFILLIGYQYDIFVGFLAHFLLQSVDHGVI
jgi:hypothetical protein